MSTEKTLLMLFINYIIVIPWMGFFRMGILSCLIMLPLTLMAVAFDYLLVEGRDRVFFWCMNLLGATGAGIILSTYMYMTWMDPDPTGIAYMLIELFSFAAIILVAALIAGRMNVRRVRRLKKTRSLYQKYAEAEGAGKASAEEGKNENIGMDFLKMQEGFKETGEASEEVKEEAVNEAPGEKAKGGELSKFRMVVK